jgi:hypothetical protein
MHEGPSNFSATPLGTVVFAVSGATAVMGISTTPLVPAQVRATAKEGFATHVPLTLPEGVVNAPVTETFPMKLVGPSVEGIMFALSRVKNGEVEEEVGFPKTVYAGWTPKSGPTRLRKAGRPDDPFGAAQM